MAKNILVFTKDYAGQQLLKYLKELKIYPFIASVSKNDALQKNTGSVYKYHKDFQIFEVSSSTYEYAKNIIPQADYIICVDWKKDYFSGINVNCPVYYMQPSLLPKYRGYGAVSQQILRGVIYSGVTIYEYNGIIDGGDIVYQKEIKIEDYFNASDFIDITSKKTAEFIKELYNNKKFEKSKQNNSIAFYLPKTRSSSKVVDFNASAVSLYNFIRAYSFPYGMVSFYYKGKEYKIASASIESWSGVEGRPGEVIWQNDYGLIVACGSGSILIKEVEIDGSIMKAHMLNAFDGDIFL